MERCGNFPKQARLLKHGDFDRVYRQGRRLFSTSMTVFWMRREGGDAIGPRVGLTVGRVLGGSVVRNRIRRRVREAVRFNLAQLAAPVDVVINPRKSAQKLEFAPLLQEVAEAFAGIVAGRGAAAAPRATGRRVRPLSASGKGKGRSGQQ